MIPKERVLEGINFYFLFLITIWYKGVDQLHGIRGEGQEVLDSQ
jgi:hypothetical protein